MSRLIIAGGGLAGSLTALALARRRPEVDLLLLEQGDSFGGNHTWSYFDTDVEAASGWVLEGVRSTSWPAHQVRFPRRSRTIAVGYNSIRSADLDEAVRTCLSPGQYRLNATVDRLTATSVRVDDETIAADAVIDARGPSSMAGLELGWQKFVGRYYRFAQPHGVRLPVIMDATVPQFDGYRFVYQLPIGARELLVEDTYYSAAPFLDRELLGTRLEHLAMEIGAGVPDLLEEESGVLPVVMGGDLEALWGGSDLPLIGLRGGFFHPTTSYSLPDAVANAALIARQSNLTSRNLSALLRKRAQTQWRDRAFFRLLNRMLFQATEPDEAYRVLEHFYRLPPALISRFYAAHLSGLDKLRIVTGKPPVDIGRAFSTLLRSAA